MANTPQSFNPNCFWTDGSEILTSDAKIVLMLCSVLVSTLSTENRRHEFY